MPDRFETQDRLAGAVRSGLPEVAAAWLAPARAELEILTRSAADPGVDDAAFLQMVRRGAAGLPALMERLDTASLSDAMEAAMGAAMANGIMARQPAEGGGQ